MIHTIKKIDYKNAKFTEKELQDYFNKMGMTNIEVKKKEPEPKPKKVNK